MATAKKGGVILELTTSEAEFLAGLLGVATDWDKDPIAQEIYEALDGETDKEVCFNLEAGSFVSEK